MNKQKHHFQVYDISPIIRSRFLAVCKIIGKSGSRVVEDLMKKFIKKNAGKL